MCFSPPRKAELPGGPPSGVSATVGEQQLEALFGSGTELVHHVTCIQPRGRAFYGALQVRRSEDLHGSNVPVTVGSEKILSRGSFFSWTVTRGLIPGLSMELRSAICFFFF